MIQSQLTLDYRRQQTHTTAISDLMLSVVMYSFSVSISEFWGIPKSKISAYLSERDMPTTRRHTVKKLVNEDKVVFHAFLVKLPKVASRHGHKPIEKLKDQGGRCIGSQVRPVSLARDLFTLTHLVTPTTKMLLTRTWKKDVDPRVMMGERTSGLEMT